VDASDTVKLEKIRRSDTAPPTSKDLLRPRSVGVELGARLLPTRARWILDGEPVGAHFIPLEQLQAVGAKRRRMRAESQRRSFSSTGTRTLMALSLMTCAWRHADELGSETAMVRRVMIDVHHEGRSELPSPCR